MYCAAIICEISVCHRMWHEAQKTSWTERKKPWIENEKIYKKQKTPSTYLIVLIRRNLRLIGSPHGRYSPYNGRDYAFLLFGKKLLVIVIYWFTFAPKINRFFYIFYVWKISIAKIYITSRISLQRSLVGTFFFSRFPKKRWKNSHKIWFSACSTYHEPRGIYSSPANDIWYRMHLFPKWLRQSANNLRFFLLSRKAQRRNVLSFPPNHFYYYIRKICNWGEKVAKLTLSFFQKIGKKLDTFHTVWP